MGIEIPIQPPPPLINCAILFPPDEAPGIMEAIVTGIEKGPLWVPADGEPLNGNYTLTQDPVNPCGWGLIAPPFFVAWWVVLGQTVANLRLIGPPFTFHLLGTANVEPWFNIDGDVPAPAEKFTGGKFRVMW